MSKELKDFYRVYEAVNNDGKKFKEHAYFERLEDAELYAHFRHQLNPKSTFVVNYSEDDGRVSEQYYGDWTN